MWRGVFGFASEAEATTLLIALLTAAKFRIKIWDKNNADAIVYDNQLNAGDDANPTTALAGGSIVIHKK